MAEEQIQHRKSGSVVSAHYFVLIWRSIVFEKSAYEKKKKKKYLRHKASNNSLKRLVRISKSGSLSTCPFLPAISFILFLYSFFSHRLPSIPTTTMLTSSFWIEVRTNVKQINIKTKLVTKIWGEEGGDWKAHDIGSISLSSTEAAIFKTLNPGSNSDFS